MVWIWIGIINLQDHLTACPNSRIAPPPSLPQLSALWPKFHPQVALALGPLAEIPSEIESGSCSSPVGRSLRPSGSVA